MSNIRLSDDELQKLNEYKAKNVPHTLRCAVTGEYIGEDPNDHEHHYVVVKKDPKGNESSDPV